MVGNNLSDNIAGMKDNYVQISMKKNDSSAISLVLLSFFTTSMILTVYLAQSDWGKGFTSAYKMSDAALYLHKAWYTAFIDINGGSLSAVIPVSPYVFLQSLAYKLFGPYIVTPFITNILLLSTASVFLSLLAFNLFNRTTALITILLFAFCGPIVFYSGITSKESSVIFFLCTSLYFFERYVNRRSVIVLSLFFFFFFGLVFERNNFLAFLPFLLLSHVVYEKQKLYKYLFSLYLMFFVILVLLLSRTDEPLVSPVGLNFYIGNSSHSSGTYIRTPGIRDSLLGHNSDSKKLVEADLGHTADNQTIMLYWFKKSLSEIQQEPLQYAVLLVKKAAMLFAQHAPGSPEQFVLWRWQRPSLAIALFDYGVILALAVSGLILLRTGKKSYTDNPVAVYIIPTIIIIYAATIWLFFINERYRFPIMILLIPYAAFFMQLVIRRSENINRFFYVSVALLIFTFSFLLNHINPAGPGWTENEEKLRIREERKTQEQLQLALLKQDVILQPDNRKWQRLSYIYRQHKLYDDADKFMSFVQRPPHPSLHP